MAWENRWMVAPWLTFDLLGLACLSLLLLTLCSVRTLPQRSNPFLLNLLVVTTFSTIPPALLLFGGHQEKATSASTPLCTVQAIFMDAVAPMFGTALLILVVHTLIELRAAQRKESPISLRHPIIKSIFILLPEAVFMVFSVLSAVNISHSMVHIQNDHFVFCANMTAEGTKLRRYQGYFMVTCGILEVITEIFIARCLLRFRASRSKDRASYRTNVHFAIRLFVFSGLQLVPILLAIINVFVGSSNRVNIATQFLESLNALATFFVFGTQQAILESWMFWRRFSPTSRTADKEDVQISVGTNVV